MSKKLCSILLAFAMIMLTITNAFAAVQFENVEGSTFKIENLKELGFISGYGDGSLRLDQYIKRSEFAKVLVNAFDKEQEAEAIKGKFKPFKDVDESHWANGIISIVKNLKGVNNTQIINGYPDGTFRPEEHITNAEALKMLVCCVKGDLTEEMYKNAEWPTSWVKWAIELGIIGAESDVPNIVDMNAKVTRGNVFTMFYNAFEEDEVERPIEKTEEKEPEKKTEDKKEEKSVAPDRHAGSRHDRYDRYPEYPYYPDLPIVPFEPSVPEVKTYTISIDSSANGIVSADKYSAEEGEIVNLRIMPNEGYKLDTLEVKDEFGNKVQLVNQWFAMPSSNVVVSAKFVEETVKPVEFDKENIKNIEIQSEPSKLNYVEGERLDLSGLVILLTDINDNTVEVPYNDFLEYGIDVEPVDGTVLTSEDNGKQITVSKSGIEAKTNPVEVKELEYNDDLFASLEIISEPENLSYTEKENLDLTGLKVKLTDKNGKIKEVELNEFATNGITTEPANGDELTTSNNGQAVKVTKGTETVKTNTLTVTELPYNDDLFASLEIIGEPENLSYTEKENLDLTGLKVKLTDSNGKTKEVELQDFEANGLTTEPTDGAILNLTDNGKAISVTKGEKTQTTTGKLEITELTYDETKFESLEIISEPENLSYTEKDKLDLTGLKVRLTDSNGKTKEVAIKDFAANGITTEPANGTELSLENNGKAVSVKKSSKTVETTKKLEITELPYNDDLFESLKIITEPTNLKYKEKEQLNLTGLKVKLTDSNGKTKEVDQKDFANYNITTEPGNGDELKTTDSGKAISVKKASKTVETTNKLEVTELEYDDKKFESLEIIDEPENLSYTEKDKLDLTGLKVKLTDTNGKTKEVELKEFAANGIKTEPENGAILSLQDNGKAISVTKGEVTKTTTGKLEITELAYDETKFESLEIIDEPENLSYTEKDKLDLTGLKVKLTDTNGKSKEVELQDFANYNITTEPGNGAELKTTDNGKAITVTKSSKTVETTKKLEVTELLYNDDLFASLEIIAEPTNLSYTEKENLDLTGLKVKLTDTNGKTKEVELKDFANYNITTEPGNGAELKTTDNGKAISVKKASKTVETTKKLEVTELEYDDTKFDSLEIISEPTNLKYKEKDKLDLTGLKVRLTDSNGKTKEVELKDFANYKITTEPANEATLSLADKGKAISVKKGETTATTKNTIEIIVFNPDKIVGIKVKNQPNKMVYDEGMPLDLDGMVITLTDENGLTKDVEFASGVGTEYSKYIKTSIEDRNILGEEHNEKFIIVSLNQNPNIKTQTEILIVKHYFTIKYRGIWIAGFMNIPDDGLQEKVEEGSLWEYPSNEGKKITLDRTGFEFIGWQTEDGREIKTPFRPSKDMVMVAKWRDKNQPIMEYLKEQFETAAKLSTSIVKDKNKESLGLEYNEKVITIVPAKMEAFNIAEYNLINELQKLVKENFLTGYTINSKTRELNSSLTENQMLEYLIRDFASIANVNVSGLDYSNKSQVSDKVKEILTTLANSEKTVEITVNLAKDDVNTTDIYKFVFLQYKDMSTSEVESINNFYNNLMKNTVNSVNQQGIWDNDPNNPDASVKVPVFKTEYDGNKNLYTININTRYTSLLAKQTAGTGFKTAIVNFLTGGHVGKNGVVQNDLQKVKITQTGTGKSVIVDRDQLNEIVHVTLGNMKNLLAPFSYIFMPEGKDVNTLSLQDLVGQEATFEYTYVNENYETYTVVRTIKFGVFTE